MPRNFIMRALCSNQSMRLRTLSPWSLPWMAPSDISSRQKRWRWGGDAGGNRGVLAAKLGKDDVEAVLRGNELDLVAVIGRHHVVQEELARVGLVLLRKRDVEGCAVPIDVLGPVGVAKGLARVETAHAPVGAIADEPGTGDVFGIVDDEHVGDRK